MMNKYMRAVGFSKFGREEMNNMFSEARRNPDEHLALVREKKDTIVEISKSVGEGIGLKWSGTMEGTEEYFEHCIPFVRGYEESYRESINMEEKSEGNAYLGAFEDMRAGVFFIFYLQNSIDYLELLENKKFRSDKTKIALSALSIGGTILLPMMSSQNDRTKKEQERTQRIKLLTAARNGDERAMENLAFQDMDIYSRVTKRIQHEDVFSIVESSFMPYSLESDQYSVVVDIIKTDKIQNNISGEYVWCLKVSYNGILIDLYINDTDLLGEPKEGRRFKGNIWLQGQLMENI